MAPFATISPGPLKLTLAVSSRCVPVGYTVTNPALRASVAVTVSAAAEASAGTPPTPATLTRIVDASRRVKPNAAAPRVSARRDGPTAT